MNRRKRTLMTFAVAAAAILPLGHSSHAQDFGVRSKKPSAYPVENRPKIDEKAYKAALDRIPEPTQKYDPWGNARPAGQVTAGKKPN